MPGGRLGRSSAAYQIGIFDANEDDASALGTFVHVYVSKEGRPTPVCESVRAFLESLVVDPE